MAKLDSMALIILASAFHPVFSRRTRFALVIDREFLLLSYLNLPEFVPARIAISSLEAPLGCNTKEVVGPGGRPAGAGRGG